MLKMFYFFLFKNIYRSEISPPPFRPYPSSGQGKRKEESRSLFKAPKGWLGQPCVRVHIYRCIYGEKNVPGLVFF